MAEQLNALLSFDGDNVIAEIPDSAGELQGYAIQQPPGLCPPALWGWECLQKWAAQVKAGGK